MTYFLHWVSFATKFESSSLMNSGLSTDQEFSIAELDLPQHDFASGCAYQPFGEARKRDTGVCDNPDANGAGTTNILDAGGVGSGSTKFDANGFMLRRVLAISKGLPDNPCEQLLNVLCCLGPQVLGTVYSCTLFHGGLNCLQKLGANIYCCGNVDITGNMPWPYTGTGCI